jgi:hypothetical protein
MTNGRIRLIWASSLVVVRSASEAYSSSNSTRNAWNDLPAALDRMGDPRHGARFHKAAASKAQLQAVQIEFQALAVHGRDG